MIHSFEIHRKDLNLFKKFAAEAGLTLGTDYKFTYNSDYKNFLTDIVLILFPDRLQCEYIEMTWHMLKDEQRRNQVAMAT